ncbi:MAG: zinc-ribbon domain-containing protein [Acidobacteria bacterium]|nr:zinc-ribbon domain-containing protein [Acidobacteriota bacterium]
MIIECPQCKAKYRLDPNQFAGKAQLQVRCTRCHQTFPVHAPSAGAVPQQPSTAPLGVQEATLVSQAGTGLSLPPGKRLSLTVNVGKDKGKVHQVSKPRMVLGRSGTDIVVDDSEVSRQHCALEVHGARVLVVDLGSTNGTFVGGQRIEASEIEHLGEFRIGGTTFMLTVFDSVS